MGATNTGNQFIIYKFKTPLDGGPLNKLLHGVMGPGVILGFSSSFLDDELTIGAGGLIINDGTRTIRIDTADSILVTMSAATPYLIARFLYAETEPNWCDFLAVASGSIGANDVVIAKVSFSGPDIFSVESFFHGYEKVVNTALQNKFLTSDIIIGTQIQVDSKQADITINGITDGLFPIGTKALVLNGTHALTANRTLINTDIEFISESSEALINPNGFVFSLSGGRSKSNLNFTNFVAGDVSILGSGSLLISRDLDSWLVTKGVGVSIISGKGSNLAPSTQDLDDSNQSISRSNAKICFTNPTVERTLTLTSNFSKGDSVRIVVESSSIKAKIESNDATHIASYLNGSMELFALKDSPTLSSDWSIGEVTGGAKTSFRAGMTANMNDISGQEKVIYDTTTVDECFDNNKNYDNDIYRFTPTVYGYYSLGAQVSFFGSSLEVTASLRFRIWRNATVAAEAGSGAFQAGGLCMRLTDILFADGISDYFEVTIQNSTSNTSDVSGGTEQGFFYGYRVGN